jgi:hypothetical protein
MSGSKQRVLQQAGRQEHQQQGPQLQVRTYCGACSRTFTLIHLFVACD